MNIKQCIIHIVRTQVVLSRCGTALAVRIKSERPTLCPIAQVSLLAVFYMNCVHTDNFANLSFVYLHEEILNTLRGYVIILVCD